MPTYCCTPPAVGAKQFAVARGASAPYDRPLPMAAVQQLQRWLIILIATTVLVPTTLLARELPRERHDQPWLIHSLALEAGLANKNIFTLDFAKTNAAPLGGKVYLAASDGLYVGDGFAWKRYSSTNGLPSDFVRCVLITRSGQLWVGTDKGAGTFDGQRFDAHGSERGLAGPNVRRIIEDTDGSIWFCSDSWPLAGKGGGLTSYKNGQWHPYTMADGLPSAYVANYFRDSKGRQYAATLAGLAVYENQRWQPVDVGAPDRKINWGSSCFAETTAFGLMYSNGREVFLKGTGEWELQKSVVRHEHGICATRDGDILACADTSLGFRTFVSWGSNGWQNASAEFPVTPSYVEDIREAPDGAVWVVGFDCLMRWERRGSEWSEWSPAPLPEQVDDAGTVWFSRPRPELQIEKPLRYDKGKWEALEDDYSGWIVETNQSIWVWTTNSLWHHHNDTEDTYLAPNLGLSSIERTTIDRSGAIFIAGLTTNDSLAVTALEKNRSRPLALPKLENPVIHGDCGDPRSGVWYLLSEAGNRRHSVLQLQDGAARLFPIPAEAVGLFDRGIMVDRAGTCWLFGDNGAVQLPAKASAKWEPLRGLPAKKILYLHERDDGLWFACHAGLGGANALAHLQNGRLTIHPTDVLLSASRSATGELLYGSKGKFYRVLNGPNAEVVEATLPTGALIYSVIAENPKTYWLGTGGRVFRFEPDPSPPRTEITSVVTNVIAGNQLAVNLWGHKPFRPITERQDFQFTWQLDGGEWSPYQRIRNLALETGALKSGPHTLAVRARDTALMIAPAAATFAFTVVPRPIQNRPWFFPVVAASLLALAALSALTTNARSRLATYAQGLEAMVHERTAALEADNQLRKLTEAALRTSEERYRSLIEQASDGILISNQDGFYLEVNTAACRLLGYSSKEILGMNRRQMVAASELARLPQELPLLDQGGVLAGEWHLMRKDGSIFPAEVSAKRLSDGRNLAIVRDITTRKEAERKLQKQELTYRLLFEANPHPMWVYDRSTLGYLAVNEAAVKTYGFTREEFLKLTIRDIRPPEDVAEALRKIASMPEGPTHVGISRHRRKDGTIFLADVHATSIENFMGRSVRLGTSIDITERAQLEAQLRQSQKMESIGQLAGGVAHDFNNILTIIEGNASLILTSGGVSWEVSESAREISDAVERAANLSRQLLTFSRRQVMQPKLLNPNEIVANLMKMLHRVLGEHIVIQFESGASQLLINADAGMMDQVLLNLAINSRDAMSKGGRLSIRTSACNFSDQDSLENPEALPGPYVCLTVSDTGSGIPPENLPHIFEPFFTTKDVGKGTGLGLATVYGIVKQHRGWIQVSSQPGRGTQFEIFLPAHTTAGSHDSASRQIPSLEGGHECILVVEDEPGVRKLAAGILGKLGYRVLQAGSGVEAGIIWAEHRSAIDLLFTDLVMPGGISGRELAERLQSEKAGLRVIYSSGYSPDSIGRDFLVKPGVNFIAKPYTQAELAESIRRCLANRS